MPNSLLEISKVSFREEFSSQIYNSYDVGSKQNGLLVIYRIYLKSFMIFSGLYMCCFGFTKLLGTQTSSKFSAPVVPTWSACMRAWTRGLATSRPTSTWRVPHGLVGSVPARGKQSPSSTALSLSLNFLVLFSSTHVPPLWCLAVDHKRCRPDGP
jgi:hypothetical protein